MYREVGFLNWVNCSDTKNLMLKLYGFIKVLFLKSHGKMKEHSWVLKNGFSGYLISVKLFWIYQTPVHQLLNQYNKLEESKILIQKNAIQLKTAHEISKSIRQSLDISKTLNTIAETLINSAGFSYVYIKLFKDIEGNNLEVESTRKSQCSKY